jgi:hypothetical protein
MNSRMTLTSVWNRRSTTWTRMTLVILPMSAYVDELGHARCLSDLRSLLINFIVLNPRLDPMYVPGIPRIENGF